MTPTPTSKVHVRYRVEYDIAPHLLNGRDARRQRTYKNRNDAERFLERATRRGEIIYGEIWEVS